LQKLSYTDGREVNMLLAESRVKVVVAKCLLSDLAIVVKGSCVLDVRSLLLHTDAVCRNN